METPPRLRWACRRGMLELDVLLGQFLENAYLRLSRSEQLQFEKLLSCNDQELYEWLTGKNIPDAEFNAIIEKIRNHAKANNKT